MEGESYMEKRKHAESVFVSMKKQDTDWKKLKLEESIQHSSSTILFVIIQYQMSIK